MVDSFVDFNKLKNSEKELMKELKKQSLKKIEWLNL